MKIGLKSFFYKGIEFAIASLEYRVKEGLTFEESLASLKRYLEKIKAEEEAA